MSKPNVIFVLSVDTEEEWDWDQEFPTTDCAVSNVHKLPAFQKMCVELGVRPTYFVDYAVADSAEGTSVLKDIVSSAHAEVGAHLHPWCNPPFYGKTGEAESHVVNLPIEQVENKLDALHELLTTRLGVEPRSFRSGRWGMNESTLQMLADRGYTVDSSVYPFYRNEFFSCEGSPLIPYWPDWQNVLATGEQREILEIPVSAGFNRQNFQLADTAHRALSRAPFSWLRSVGLLWHTKLLRKLYLSPELTSAEDMNDLIDQCLANGHPVIHMYLHSSSLVDRVTGLMDVDGAYTLITQRIRQTLDHLNSRANVTACTLSEASAHLRSAMELAQPTSVGAKSLTVEPAMPGYGVKSVALAHKAEVDIVFSEVFPPMHGGSGRWLWEVYSRLDASQYRCVAGDTAGAASFDASAPLEIKRLDFSYRSWSDWSAFNPRGLLFYARLLKQFLRLTKNYKVRAIHCGRCIPEGVIALVLNKIRGTTYYCYIHGEDIENSATSRTLSWMLKPVLNNAALLICNSQNSHRLLLQHWGVRSERCAVVHPGTDTSKFKPAERCAQQRARLGWGDKLVILTVSRLEQRKGHDRMIEALPEIVAQHPNVVYAIVGGGPMESTLRTLVASLGMEEHVLFMPNLTDADMITCYQQADLFILPNRDIGRNIEGFGIVMIEAQATGLPVIGGQSGGTPETLKDDVTGLCVNCSVPNEIAKAVTRLIEDNVLRCAMRQAAMAHAKSYDWQHKAMEIADAIRMAENRK